MTNNTIYSKQISTGLLIGSQTYTNIDNPAYEQTLRNNAEKTYPANDIEIDYCTSEELKDMIEAKEVALDVADPLRKWKKDIKEIKMKRLREDHITDVLNGVAGSPAEQLIYDIKIKLRGERP